MTDDLVKVKEAAEILKVTTVTIYGWIKDGTLTAYRFGKTYRIKRADLLNFAVKVEESK